MQVGSEAVHDCPLFLVGVWFRGPLLWVDPGLLS